MAEVQIDTIAEKYILLRDKKAELKKQYEDRVGNIDQALDKLEGILLLTLNSLGADSVRGPHGTVYKSTRTSATVADRTAYMGWIGENFEERQVFLEARVNKTAVEQHRAATDDLPPGVDIRVETTINVRRS